MLDKVRMVGAGELMDGKEEKGLLGMKAGRPAVAMMQSGSGLV